MANPPANSPHWQYIRRVLGEPETPAKNLVFAESIRDGAQFIQEHKIRGFHVILRPEHLRGLRGSEYKAHFTNHFFDQPKRLRDEMIRHCLTQEFEMVNYQIVHTDPHAPTEADTIAADLLEEYGFPEQADKLRNGPILVPGSRYRLEGHTVFGSHGPFKLLGLSFRMDEHLMHTTGETRLLAEAEFDCTPEALMPRPDQQASEEVCD